MEIVLPVLALWLLGNVVVVLVWATHRGAPICTPGTLPAVTVPAPRNEADAPALRPAATV